jgi:hypothetical protein
MALQSTLSPPPPELQNGWKKPTVKNGELASVSLIEDLNFRWLKFFISEPASFSRIKKITSSKMRRIIETESICVKYAIRSVKILIVILSFIDEEIVKIF